MMEDSGECGGMREYVLCRIDGEVTRKDDVIYE